MTEIIDIVNYIYNERNDTIHSPCKTNSNKEGIKLKKKKKGKKCDAIKLPFLRRTVLTKYVTTLKILQPVSAKFPIPKWII